MPAPFYPAIKGTTSGTPGTGAFTPNAASSGYRAWSAVPTGWIGLVRYEDGSAWEFSWSYWNGTTLSRGSNQLFESSTGSVLSLTSAATASMIADPSDVMSHLGTVNWRGLFTAGSTFTQIGFNGFGAAGTATNGVVSNTNFLTEQPRTKLTSATTANAIGGLCPSGTVGMASTSAGHGGVEFTARFGVSQLPTGPRFFAGLSSVSFGTSTVEPSASASNQLMMFAKDSTDTNIQLLTKDGTTANKVDTGIPLVVNGWYETCLWMEPGSNKVFGLLIRIDTGDIWFQSTTTNCPANGSVFMANVGAQLSATTGTAAILEFGQFVVRAGQ